MVLVDAGPRAGRSGTALAAVRGVETEAARLGFVVNLAANENVSSETARRLAGSALCDRYLIGTAAERRTGGASYVRAGLLSPAYRAVDALEGEARRASAELFGGHADFRPLSGLHATICTLGVLTEPGDRVWSIDPADGGHFATAPLLARMGRRSRYIPWDRAAGTVDVGRLGARWETEGGDMVFLDHGAPLAPIPVEAVRAAIGRRPALVYDASHTLGLIAGGRFQDPLAEGCDVLQGNTHKSFPGSHKGVIVFADSDAGERAAEAIGTAFVSSQSTGSTLANYVTVLEMERWATEYAAQMVHNRDALASGLLAHGFEVRTGPVGSGTHVLIIDSGAASSGYALAESMVAAGLCVNARPMAGQVVVRLGTQEVTRRGMDGPAMAELADLIAVVDKDGPTPLVRGAVRDLAVAHRRVGFSFDDDTATAWQA